MLDIALFTRYPGSTDPRLCDIYGCDSIIEPFGGSCRVSLSHSDSIKNFYWADVDNSVRAVMDVYAMGSPLTYGSRQTQFDLRILEWQSRFFQDKDKAWAELKQCVQDFQSQRYRYAGITCHAADSILIRSLAYAGIMRTGKSSNDINVTMGRDQLQRFMEGKLPKPVYCNPNKTNVITASGWEVIFKRLPNDAQALALIDPPYYGDMEPCYLGHRPKEKETLDLFTQSIEAALKHPGVHRIIAKNYWSNEVADFVDGLGKDYTTFSKGKMNKIRPDKPDGSLVPEVFFTIYKHKKDVQRQLTIV